ncbi:MAG: nucleotide pyrophosphohydrolase [Myxococcota bacterium]
MSELDVAAVQQTMRAFVREREWDVFHSPKNLVMALSGEVGELNELFQWLTEEQSHSAIEDPAWAEAVRDEIADVLLYILRLADVLGVDLGAAVRNKMAKNAAKYPAELVRGSARKYTDIKLAPPAPSDSVPDRVKSQGS